MPGLHQKTAALCRQRRRRAVKKSTGGAIGTVGSTVVERRRWKDRNPMVTSAPVAVLCLNPHAGNPDICGTEFQEIQNNGVMVGGHTTKWRRIRSVTSVPLN